nr:RDD family protein [uncultured Microbacterium sp.]
MTQPAIDSSAPVSRRAIAYLIDALISGAIGTVGFVIVAVIAFMPRPVEELLIVMPLAYGVLLLVLLAWFVVYTIMQTRGGSIGMRAQGVRLASASDGEPLGFARALLRNVVFGAAAAIVVGYFTPLFDGSGRFQGWHDKVANAVVLDAKKSAAPIRRAKPSTGASQTTATPGRGIGVPPQAAPVGMPPVPLLPPSPLAGGYAATVSAPPGYPTTGSPTAPDAGQGHPGFVVPRPDFAAPPSGFAAPPSGFAAPPSRITAPPSGFVAPQPSGTSSFAAPTAPSAPPVISAPPAAQPQPSAGAESAPSASGNGSAFSVPSDGAAFAVPSLPPQSPAPEPAGSPPSQPAAQPASPAFSAPAAGTDALIAFVPGVTSASAAAPASAAVPSVAPAASASAPPAPAAYDSVDSGPVAVDLFEETIVQPRSAPDQHEDELESTRISIPGHRLLFTWDDGSRVTVSRRTLFGRNPAHEDGAERVTVRDETLSLSKTHFEAAAEVSGGWVLDRHSTNGMTIVRDGERIDCPPGQRVPVRLGDAIEIGDRILTIGGYV